MKHYFFHKTKIRRMRKSLSADDAMRRGMALTLKFNNFI